MSDSIESNESKKQFPYPFTLETLPPHQARTMTQAERDALPPFTVYKDDPGPGFLTVTGDREGKLLMFPKQGRSTELRYYPHNGQDIDAYLARENLPDPEADVAFRAFSGCDLGMVWSQNLALDLFDFARRNSFEASPEEQLLAAGFVAQETPGAYSLSLGSMGDFDFYLKETGGWLIFQRPGVSSWTNLLSLNTHSIWHNNQGRSPVLWPDTIQNPINAIVGMAVQTTKLWHPLLPYEPKQRVKRLVR